MFEVLWAISSLWQLLNCAVEQRAPQTTCKVVSVLGAVVLPALREQTSNVVERGRSHRTLFVRTYVCLSAAAKSLQSCPTLCDHTDCSPPGSSIHGIFQARVLEWVAISFSNAWKWKVKVKSLSRVRLLATPRTAAYQAPPSMGFSRQEY